MSKENSFRKQLIDDRNIESKCYKMKKIYNYKLSNQNKISSVIYDSVDKSYLVLQQNNDKILKKSDLVDEANISDEFKITNISILDYIDKLTKKELRNNFPEKIIDEKKSKNDVANIIKKCYKRRF